MSRTSVAYGLMAAESVSAHGFTRHLWYLGAFAAFGSYESDIVSGVVAVMIVVVACLVSVVGAMRFSESAIGILVEDATSNEYNTDTPASVPAAH